MRRFSAIYIAGGSARRMTFEAEDLDDAKAQADKWGVGVEGEAPEIGPIRTVPPEAFDLKATMQMVGGLSRATVYNLLWAGKLERVPGVKRLLVTRRSIEQFVSGKN